MEAKEMKQEQLNKKEYAKPFIEAESLELEDIIAVSGRDSIRQKSVYDVGVFGK